MFSFRCAGLVCVRNFDLYACWPDGLPNTTVGVRCPWYLPWHNEGRRLLTHRRPLMNPSHCTLLIMLI